MTTYETKHKLYQEYVRELNEFMPDPMTDAEARQSCEKYINDTNCKWINIWAGPKLAGFLIVAKKEATDEVHPECDYAIAQAYVDAEVRGKGLMTKALTDYVTAHPGIWNALVLKKNKDAITFWNNRFKEMKYREHPISKEELVGANADALLQFAWSPKEKEREKCLELTR